MALKLYKETTVNAAIALRNFIDWLTGTTRGDLTTSGPTGVTVIEADDGTIRETSGDGTLAGLGAGNLWRTAAAIPSGGWIVVDFPGTGTLPGFQVYWHNSKAGGNNRWGFQLLPNRDWATGGSQGSSPTQPSTTVPAAILNGQNQAGTDWGASETVFGFCDEGVLVMGVDNGSNKSLMYYAGEVDDPSSADVNPVVCGNNVGQSPIAQGDWSRLSPLDQVTKLGGQGTGNSQTLLITNWFALNNWSPSDPQMTDFGDRPRTPIGPAFVQRGHQHFMGWCRYVQLINSSVGDRGTSDSLDRLFLGDFNLDQGAYLFPWDGATAYP